MTTRAFAAYAEGDREGCDALLNEGRGAAGAIFTALAEHVVSALPYRVDDPAWDDFLARLAMTVLRPRPQAADPAPAGRPFSRLRSVTSGHIVISSSNYRSMPITEGRRLCGQCACRRADWLFWHGTFAGTHPPEPGDAGTAVTIGPPRPGLGGIGPAGPWSCSGRNGDCGAQG